MEVTNPDIQQARIKQVLFKSQLRSVLYGVRTADPALFSVQQNPFAVWVLTILKPRYSAYPQVQQLEQVLQQLLREGQQLVSQYQRGRIEEARLGMSGFNLLTDRVDALLQELGASLAESNVE